MLTSRKGISSLQLSKELEIKQPTAWYMMTGKSITYKELVK